MHIAAVLASTGTSTNAGLLRHNKCSRSLHSFE
jgi:hypothetical protein